MDHDPQLAAHVVGGKHNILLGAQARGLRERPQPRRADGHENFARRQPAKVVLRWWDGLAARFKINLRLYRRCHDPGNAKRSQPRAQCDPVI